MLDSYQAIILGMLMPFLITFFFEEYGYRGAFLLTGKLLFFWVKVASWFESGILGRCRINVKYCRILYGY